MSYLIVLLIFCIGELSLSQNYSCSGFVIKDNNNILLAKNLDWALGNGLIIYNPKNKLKKSIYTKSNKNSWISKYSSITFNHLGLNQPLGGMNEEGLTIEELSTWPAKYFNNNNFIVDEFEWIQYQLDNYPTIEEVLNNIKKISISKFYFLLHYLIADNTGNVAIIEFIGGRPKIYQDEFLSIPVLTNNNYSELLKYSLKASESHLDISNMNHSQGRFLKISSI